MRTWSVASIYETVPMSFARSLRDQPDDMGARLVYADWLEERGEPWKAEYVRTRAHMLPLSPLPADRDQRYAELRERLHILQSEVMKEGALVDAAKSWLRFTNAIDLSTLELDYLQLEPIPAAQIPESNDERLRPATYPLAPNVDCAFVLERAWPLRQWPAEDNLHEDRVVTREMISHWGLPPSFLAAKCDDIDWTEHWEPLGGHSELWFASGDEGYWVNYLISVPEYEDTPYALKDPVLMVFEDEVAVAARNNPIGRQALLDYACSGGRRPMFPRPMVRQSDPNAHANSWEYMEEEAIPPGQRKQLGPRPPATPSVTVPSSGPSRPRRQLTLLFGATTKDEYSSRDGAYYEELESSAPELFYLSLLYVSPWTHREANREFLGAFFDLLEQGRFQRLHSLDLSRAKFDNSRLAALALAEDLTALKLSGSNLNRVGCEHLLGVRNLRCLDLEGVKIDSDAVQLLGDMKLENLCLNQVAVDDAALNAFLDMTSLRVLSLDGTPVTNRGVASLASSSLQLEELGISGTQTDDNVAFSIVQMPSLRALRGGSSEMSLFLHQEMPHLRVKIDPRP